MTIGPHRRRVRHTRLHDALSSLLATGRVQAVEVPTDRTPVYYQKLAHKLAAYQGVRIRTGIKTRAGQSILLIQESAF